MKFLECIELNPKINMIKGQDYPFIEMTNISTCYRSPNKVEIKAFDSGVRFQDGDTVVARITPCLQNGKRFYCQDIGTGFGSTEYLVFRPINNSIDNKYLYYFMQTDFIKQSMINSMTGATGRQRVNNDVFNNIEASFPEIDIQKKKLVKYSPLTTTSSRTTESRSSCWRNLRRDCIKSGSLTCASPDGRLHQLLTACRWGGRKVHWQT